MPEDLPQKVSIAHEFLVKIITHVMCMSKDVRLGIIFQLYFLFVSVSMIKKGGFHTVTILALVLDLCFSNSATKQRISRKVIHLLIDQYESIFLCSSDAQ